MEFPPWWGLLLGLTMTTLSAVANTNTDWHAGCYAGNVTQKQFVDGEAEAPVKCCALCLNAGARYTIINPAKECACLPELPVSALRVPGDNCSRRCWPDSQVPTQCGGPDVYSVYRVDGPYLRNMTAKVLETNVYMHEPMSIQVVLHFAGPPNMSLGLPMGTLLGELEKVNMTVDFSDGETRDELLTAKGQVLQNDQLYTFTTPGNHSIEIRASNTISVVYAKLNVTVKLPVPDELQVVVRMSDKPSCIPSEYSNAVIKRPPHQKSVAVFVGESTHFVASVKLAWNLTYDWTFGDEGSEITQNVTATNGCNDSACVTNKRNHTYNMPGEYILSVTASNTFGQASDTLHVIAVKRIVQEVTLTLGEGQQDIATPGALVGFIVSMVTTDRHDMQLALDFGDGDQPKYILLDRQAKYLGQQHGASDEAVMKSDYGMGSCKLKLHIVHIYAVQNEGYDVTARVWTNHSDITSSLKTPLVIQRRLVGMKVQGPRKGIIGKNYTFMADFNGGTPAGVHYKWVVIFQNDTVDEPDISYNSKLEYMFTTNGRYNIQLMASNKVNARRYAFNVHVHKTISDLQVSLINGGRNIIATGVRLNFRANVSCGSDVTFTWNFSDEGEDENATEVTMFSMTDKLNSFANHTFSQQGTYMVTVKASNAYDTCNVELPVKIIVQDPIDALQVVTDSPTMLNNKTMIHVIVSGGSDVHLGLEYQGRVIEHANYSHFANWSVRLDIGMHTLHVTAYNGVSRKSQEISIEVQNPVGKVSLITKVDLVLGELVTFIALGQEKTGMVRADQMYTWYIEDKIVAYTRTPILERLFTGNAKQVKVSVKVENKVSMEMKTSVFALKATGHVRLTQGAIKEFGPPTVFTLIDIPQECEMVLIWYKSLDRFEFSNFGRYNVKNTSVFSWEMSFAAPGAYTIEVSPLSNCWNSTIQVSGVISLESRITNMTLLGPSIVAIHGEGAEPKWKAVYDNGSHVLYDWSINGERVSINPYNEFRHTFKTAGIYELAVNTSNSLSWQIAQQTIYIQQPLREMSITTRPAASAHRTLVNITVGGGPLRQLDVDMGDGTVYYFRNEDLIHQGEYLRTGTANGTDRGPRIKYPIGHTYASEGIYTIQANVSNLLSSLSARAQIAVEVHITGVEVTADGGKVMEVGQTVIVNVTWATGNNLKCDWLVWPSIVGDSESDGQTLYLTPEASGHYNVTVFVTYAFDIAAYVTASLPYLLHVVEPLEELSLRESNDRNWVKLGPVVGDEGQRNGPVTFIAIAESGSDVTFSFSFGDGTSVIEKGSTERGEPASATVTHVYHKAGVHTITVTGSNPLGSMTAVLGPLHVQIPPATCAFQRHKPYKEHLVAFRDLFRMNVSTTGGTDVKVDWHMGDTNEYIDKKGEIEHMYNGEGSYALVVKCYNLVGEKQDKMVIQVATAIMGVHVVVISGPNPYPDNEDIHFQAKLDPPDIPDQDVIYSWDFGELNMPPTETKNSTYKHKYSTFGQYSVHVLAANSVSRRNSTPVVVNIVQKLGSVDILITKEPLVGQRVRYEAYHYTGSNVTYTWNFGDGPIITARGPEIYHTYYRTGTYMITVWASNPFNNRTASKRVFTMEAPCNTPVLKLLESAPGQQREQNVARGQEFKLEMDVTINCSLTSVANYNWTLSRLPEGVVQWFIDPILFIPRYTLEYGTYDVMLRVAMNNTRVFAEKRTQFKVVPAYLMAVISGGLQRESLRNESLIMDGSKSYDPDNPDSSNIIYKWACYQLTKEESSCFKHNLTVNMNTPIINLTGSDFTLNATTFVFNLTVYRKDDLEPGYPTSQAVQMKTGQILDMTLTCSECDDGLINSDQRLIVEARHPGVAEEELEYSWVLYKVVASNDVTLDFDDPAECVPADGSGALRHQAAKNGTKQPLPGSEVKNQTVSSTSTSATETVPSDPPTSTSSSTTSSTSTTTTTTRGSPIDRNLHNPQQSQGNPPGQPDFPISLSQQEGPSGRRLDSSGSSSGGRGGSNPGPTPAGGSAANSGLKPSDSETEAHAGGRGTGSGLGSGARYPHDQHRNNAAGNKQSSGGPAHPVVDGNKQKRIMNTPHILLLTRTRIVIKPWNTTTGTKRRAIVFKPDVLQKGLTYIIESIIKHKGNHRKGTALTYVVVNQSPNQGTCTLSPDNGEEMLTDFKVICFGWKDKHLPIHYEISYSLEEGTSRDLIYQGLNHETTFKLPAGKLSKHQSKNQTVLVIIAILDSYGARTTVCSLSVKVRVAAITSGSLEAEYHTLQTFVSKGDNRNARLHAHLVAHKLNRLHDNAPDSDTAKRTKIRTDMLQTLKDLPMRDEYEVQQMTSAVAASTAVSNELDGTSLEYASTILEKVTKLMKNISDVKKHVDSSIITVAIQGSANIVAAASRVNKIEENSLAESTKPVIERTRWSIHNLTQTELNHTVLGEAPRKRQTDSLMTYAGRFKMSEIPTINVPDAPNFRLPSSLSAVLEKNQRAGSHGNDSADCYEMHVVTYKRNPFLYGKGMHQRVNTQVASLLLFSCGGKQIPVHNLPINDQIAVAIPHANIESLEPAKTFTLHKHSMQVHTLKVSLDPTDMSSINIEIDLEPIEQGRLFPIALLIQPNEHPTPDRHQFKKVFPATAEKLRLFLPPHQLNESTKYYLGVVDAHFNAARPRPGEVRERTYTLRMWKGQCVYWDEQTDAWSNRGCTIQPSSTMAQTDCRCRHLTAFGANSSLVPNDLNFPVNVEDFFDLNENPVTFTLVIGIIGLYIILLVFCVMSDNHDHKKGAIVHLVDNSPSHLHTYVITMETGMRRGAGTSAKVSLVLHGKEGMSETRELVSESGQPLFERNSRDTFIITLPENMGQIWKVQLWHNNAGDSPNWYLSRVIVKDVNKGQTFYFSCEKWFAVEEEDGKVEREVMALDCGLGFAKVLWAKGTQYLTDYHLWFSMMVRPSYSRFTRAQRLTCCLALLVSYMAVNATWYKESHTEYRGEFALIDLSWRAVAVGLITSLIVLPVNFLLVFIFRRSKIKKVCIEDPPDKKYYPVKRDSVISLDSTVRLLQPAVTPSIFDQSMLNWQTLQDWAQRQWTKRYQQELEEEEPDEAVKDDGTLIKPEYETVDQASSGFEDCITNEQTPTNTTIPSNMTNRTEHFIPVTSESVTDDVIRRSASCRSEKQRKSVDSELRRQHELDKYVLDSIRSHKPRRLFLPHACQYVAWILAFIIIAGCSTITVLYGFRFGKTKSIMWLQSLFFSFMQCVFVTHPLVVLLVSVYTAVKYRNDLSIFDHHDDGVIEQRTTALLKSRVPKHNVDEDLSMGIAARQRSRYLHYARPPQEKQLIEARKKIMKEKKATSVLSESICVVTLLFLLFVVAYSKDINTPFQLNTVLKDLLTKTRGEPFHSVSTIQDWHQWAKTDMLDTLYWEKWYNGQHTNHDKGYVGNSAIIGTISLRQLRVKQDRCETLNTHGIITPLCHHEYYYGNHDVTPYGSNKTWRFYESNVTRATGFEGKHAHYDGSGYQMILPNSRQYAYQVLVQLEQDDWIDRNTRGVLVEFTLYNAPTKLFSSVTLLMEQTPGGGVSSMARISSVHLFRYMSNFDNFVLVCELLLVVVTLYKLHCEVGELAWYKKAYIRNPWKATEATVVLLLLAYIACYIYRFVLVYEAVELMRATYHEEYVDIAYIAYWDEILRSLLGFIILLVIVQSLRLFRNRKVFAKFGGIYRKAGMDLIYLALMMIIWLWAYTCLGYAVFGSLTYNFSSVYRSLMTVLSLLTRQNSFPNSATVLDRPSLQLYLISFLLLVISSLTAYIIAVLTFHYRMYRDEGLPSLTTTESVTYFWTKFLQITGFNSTAPELDEDQTMIPAEFRMAAIETQVDEMLFKMNSLTGGSGLPEKPPMYFTDSDGTYGTYSTGDDGISSGGSEVRAFDEDRFEHRLHKIEDNLIANEPHLAQLLKLDAIGANVLSQERENQLRSALEFEIFRQLQVQRRNSADVRSLPSDNGQVVIHRLSSLSGSASSSGGASSARGSPISTVAMRRSREPLSRTRTEMDVLSMRSVRSVRSRSSREHGTHPPSRGSHHSLSMADALMLQDNTNGDHLQTMTDIIPLQDLMRKNPRLGQAPEVPAVAEEYSMSDEVRNQEQLAKDSKLLTVPPMTAMTPSSLRTKSPSTTPRSTPTPSISPGSSSHKRTTRGTYDTSSASEHDASSRTSPVKARNLRKTKSRGKGNGNVRCRLTPVEASMDEFGQDNDGYTSESDRETDESGSSPKTCHKT